MTREEELDWLCRLRSKIYVYMPEEWLIPMNNALDMAIKALEQEPKAGHWIVDEVQLPDRVVLNYHCSVCGRKLVGYSTKTLKDAPYCHCGAKMVESEE